MKKHQEKRFVWAVLLAGLTLAWTAIEMYAEPLSQNAGQYPAVAKAS